jgi:hypothetical protein
VVPPGTIGGLIVAGVSFTLPGTVTAGGGSAAVTGTTMTNVSIATSVGTVAACTIVVGSNIAYTANTGSLVASSTTISSGQTFTVNVNSGASITSSNTSTIHTLSSGSITSSPTSNISVAFSTISAATVGVRNAADNSERIKVDTSGITVNGNIAIPSNSLTVGTSQTLLSSTALTLGSTSAISTVRSDQNIANSQLSLTSKGNSSVAVNSPSGNVELQAGGTAVLTANSTNVTLAKPLAMGANNITTTGDISLSGTTGTFGYAPGAGGAVSHSGSSKSENLTLHRSTGTIVTGNASIPNVASSGTAAFTLFNDTINPTDFVIVKHVAGGAVGGYGITASPNSSGAKGAIIQMRNLLPNAQADALTLRFLVIKSTNA